jgi:hypothetical protein
MATWAKAHPNDLYFLVLSITPLHAYKRGSKGGLILDQGGVV